MKIGGYKIKLPQLIVVLLLCGLAVYLSITSPGFITIVSIVATFLILEATLVLLFALDADIKWKVLYVAGLCIAGSILWQYIAPIDLRNGITCFWDGFVVWRDFAGIITSTCAASGVICLLIVHTRDIFNWFLDGFSKE